MLGLGPVSFFAPWALAGAVALPVVWWLVRFLPPSPRRIRFPAVRFLRNAEQDQPSARSAVWWILLIRLAMVSALILAAAEPVYRPQAPLGASGPVVVIVDDGWAAADNWLARKDTARALILRAEREDRGVVLIPTAPASTGQAALRHDVLSAPAARRLVDALQPKPWPSDPAAAMDALFDPALGLRKAARIFWLSDGLDHFGGAGDGGAMAGSLERLMRLGPVTLVRGGDAASPILLRATETGGAALDIDLVRASGGLERAVTLIAFDAEGRAVGRAPAAFAGNETKTAASFDLPLQLRNRVTRIAVEGVDSAGGVLLLDERWRRKVVGIVESGSLGADQPLLSGRHYVESALALGNEVRSAALEDLGQSDDQVFVFEDPGTLAPDDVASLKDWIRDGGVLVVFAGPRFAEAVAGDVEQGAGGWRDLLPVRLRAGGRAIGGAMSWRRPATLAGFGRQGPFAGLDVPGDVRVTRQVLAEPDIDIETKTWARLSDGTPLVTGAPSGDGWVVLFHVTANAEWSNLPLSGLFVDMLTRVAELSQRSTANTEGVVLQPERILDGFGTLGPAPRHAASLTADALDRASVSPRHPPGYYGDGHDRRALNLSAGLDDPVALGAVPDGVEVTGYSGQREVPLATWLIAAALALLIADMLVSLRLRGYLTWRLAAGTAAVLAVAALPWSVRAEQRLSDEAMAAAVEAAARTRIAYIETGERNTDRISEIGLVGLGRVLGQRTAVELAPPVAVDPVTDELAFYPLIYWPVTAASEVPSAFAAKRINTYLSNGGMILFDAKSTDGVVADKVVRIAHALDAPRLAPVPADHVLTRAFYLLNEFPGRWSGRPVWIAPTDDQVNDGVAPVIAGSNDWTAAWAMDEFQEPLFPLVPGGERQRELAFRFGINLMMYALTGNYKADQVHIPSIMQRLGQ